MPVPTVDNSTKLCSRSFWIDRVKKLSLGLWRMSCSFNYWLIFRKMQLGTDWIFTVSQTSQIKSLKICWWTLHNLWNCSFFVIIELQSEIKFPWCCNCGYEVWLQAQDIQPGTFQASGYGLLRSLSNAKDHDICNICSILQNCWVTY